MQYRIIELPDKQPTRAALHDAGIQLATEMLAEIGGVPPQKIQIKYHKNGKPYTDSVPLHFNISHTLRHVLCAVHTAPIGVDVEQIRLPHKHTIERICSADEITFIHNDPARFTAVWTRKEAYAKLMGKGIGMGLNTIATANANELLSAINDCTVKTVMEQDVVYSIIWQE